MTFVSYAQNYEDVVLWRALRDVKEGFYVDVGAADPTVDSVTKAFYELGWSGINIEPAEPYFSSLQAERPRDVNLRVLAGSRAGVHLLHVIKDTGLSTINDGFAARHVKAGFELRDVVVPELELNQILQLRAGQPIHFLKIDVEGAEVDVLRGIDLEKHRPWIILLEATEPSSQEPTRQNWEGLLFLRGYEFAYFDGLNCFYVAVERAALKERLAVPPNVFDGFVPVAQVELQSQLAQQTERADALSKAKEADGKAIVRLRQEVTGIEGRLGQLGSELRAERAELEGRLDQARDEQHAQYAILREAFGRAEHALAAFTPQFTAELDGLKSTIATAELQARYITKRSLFEKLFFRTDGRPVGPLRRLLFHKSGEPRESFRFLVLHKNGKPRRAFSYWLKNRQALAHPALQEQVSPAASVSEVATETSTQPIRTKSLPPLSLREQYFIKRLRPSAED